MAKTKSWEEHLKDCLEVVKPGVKILGWSGEWKGAHTRLRCVCSVHGEWTSTTIHKFKMGRSCPGCRTDASAHARHNGDKFWLDLLYNFCQERDFFFEVPQPPIYGRSEIKICCPKHGTFRSTLSNIQKQRSCPMCKVDAARENNLLPDQYHVEKYMATGSFPQGSLFRRVGKTRSSKGSAQTWECYCPTCNETHLARDSNLAQGKRPCSCSGNNQKQAYINVVFDNNTPIALKFGIARNSAQRLAAQNKKNFLKMDCLAVYSFRTVRECKAAERACKRMLVCSIVGKKEMVDGYTETTYISNYDTIVDIYKKFGGVKLQMIKKSTE